MNIGSAGCKVARRPFAGAFHDQGQRPLSEQPALTFDRDGARFLTHRAPLNFSTHHLPKHPILLGTVSPMSYARNLYRSIRAKTAAPADLVVMLYDGLVRYLRRAEDAVRDARPSDAGLAVDRVLDILGYLRATLRTEDAGEVADALDELYTIWSAVVVRRVFERDAAGLVELREQILEVRDAWRQATREVARLGAPVA